MYLVVSFLLIITSTWRMTSLTTTLRRLGHLMRNIYFSDAGADDDDLHAQLLYCTPFFHRYSLSLYSQLTLLEMCSLWKVINSAVFWRVLRTEYTLYIQCLLLLLLDYKNYVLCIFSHLPCHWRTSKRKEEKIHECTWENEDGCVYLHLYSMALDDGDKNKAQVGIW